MARAGDDTLIKSIDAGFQALLERMKGDVTVQAEDGKPATPPFSPSDQIEALRAAVVWAEKRAKIVQDQASGNGKAPEGSTFDELRKRVTIGGKAAVRRGAAAEDEEVQH